MKLDHQHLKGRQTQNGVVLLVALVLLVVLSLVASFNARSVGSAELVSNNTRSSEIASQSAEAVLRYCERGVENHYFRLMTPTYTVTHVLTPTAAPLGTTTYSWQSLSNWDGATSTAVVTVIGTTALALSDAGNLIKRPPECIAQYFDPLTTRTVVVTARGFGPEVAADDGGIRPVPKGSEVWLQSILTLN